MKENSLICATLTPIKIVDTDRTQRQIERIGELDMVFIVRNAVAVILVATCVGCGDDTSNGGNRAGSAPDAAAPAADAGLDPLAAMGNENRPTGVAHCYTPLSSEHEATRAFWIAFRGGDLEARANATAGLANAAEAHPEQEEFALLNGLSNLWRVAEPLPVEVEDTQSFVNAALTAKSELERAYALCPTDHRIPAWLGPILVNMGRALDDPASIDQGLSVLQQGIDNYPAFVLFSKLLIFADYPKDDPDFQNALDAVRQNTDACTPEDPACSNHARAAHNIEGASVFLGDVFAKAGDRQAALDAFTMAQSAAEFSEWDYQPLLQDRLDTLDARIAALGNADAAEDPELVWKSTYQCSICHVQ